MFFIVKDCFGIRAPSTFRPSAPVDSSLSELSSNEVFGNGLHKVGSRHEDGDGADDVENAERHQTQAVDDGACEFPLVGRAAGVVLFPEAVGHVTHLLQDGVQLGVSHP